MNYEIHITASVMEGSMDKFRAVCEELGVKPIVIDANPLKDVMTSYRMQTDDQNFVFTEMTRQMIVLAAKGFYAMRTKVETDLTHPAALTPLPNQYFESHLQVWTQEDQLEDLKELAQGLDFHVSRNAFKPPVEGRHIRMVTVRQYHTNPERFTTRITALRKVLSTQGYEFAKDMEIEFALYDSNSSHDFPWIQSRGF
jgi:hypothetical protein